jgi:hypothetical protein
MVDVRDDRKIADVIPQEGGSGTRKTAGSRGTGGHKKGRVSC